MPKNNYRKSGKRKYDVLSQPKGCKSIMDKHFSFATI